VNLLAAAKVDDNLLSPPLVVLHKVTHSNVDNVHPEVVAPVDERSSPLELLDEVAEEMGLVGVVQLLDAPLRDYATVVCLDGTLANVAVNSRPMISASVTRKYAHSHP